MNKAYFQTMFGTTAGNVYQYVGTIPAEQDPTSVITEKFIQCVGEAPGSIVVVEVKHIIVVFSNNIVEINSSDFQLITGLEPDPVIDQTQSNLEVPSEDTL